VHRTSKLDISHSTTVAALEPAGFNFTLETSNFGQFRFSYVFFGFEFGLRHVGLCKPQTRAAKFGRRRRLLSLSRISAEKIG